MTLEYPLRPPHFLLRILPPGNKELSALPAPPRGVLDVTESMVIGEANVDNWFNELRAIEAEVRWSGHTSRLTGKRVLPRFRRH